MSTPVGDAAGSEELFASLRRDVIEAESLAVWVSGPSEQRQNVGSVGPTLYSGTAGIAFALAHYGRHYAQEWAVDLAVSAARHAYAMRDSVPSAYRLGLFGGWTGIIVALAEVGRLTESRSLSSLASRLLEELAETTPSGEFDVVSGDAGAVGGLLMVVDSLGEGALAVAEKCADRLTESARRTRLGGRAWRSPRERNQLPLTGFAHGMAGVGWALLRLAGHDPTNARAERWTEFAESAFQYEDGVFDASEGHWPDLRYYRTWNAVRLRPPPIQVAWCHGAPGIGLARLTAAGLSHDPRHATMAGVALRTTADSARTPARGGAGPGIDDLGVCHGLAGLRVVLGADSTTPASDLGAIDDVLRTAAQRAARRDMAPGLMTGRAGLALAALPKAQGACMQALLGGPSAGRQVRASAAQ